MPGDLVLDIGAGRGAITAALLARGARVVAVELDARRAQVLRERFAGRPVTVVRADATDLRLPRRAFKVVANPPFGATAAIVRRLISPASQLDTAALILPTWAIHRWAGTHRGRQCAIGPVVPRHAFRPPPPSRTGVLVIGPPHVG